MITKSTDRLFLLIVFILGYYTEVIAQCAMCRAVLESESDTTQAEAINEGIIYLMLFPYLLFVVIGFIAYRIYKKRKEKY